METGYFLLAFGWFVYLALHSVLASQRVKRIVLPFMSASLYRFVYGVIAITGLLALFLYSGSVEQTFLYKQKTILRYLGLVLATYGVIVIRLAFKKYSLREFFGLGKTTGQPLQTEGILSKVRHPLYSGTILLLIGYLLFSPRVTTFISVVCIFIYLPVGIWLEERKLIDLYGDAYKEYKKRVPMLFPRIKGR